MRHLLILISLLSTLSFIGCRDDLWELLRDMDARAWNDFRIDCTVEQLERRFAFEDCQTTVLGYIAEREAMERRANDGGYGSGACIASERQGD